MRLALLLVLASLAVAPFAQPQVGGGQPVPLQPDIAVRQLMASPTWAVRLATAPGSTDVWLLTYLGELYRLAAPYTSATLVATVADHGVPQSTEGLAAGADGAVYVSGSAFTDTTIVGAVARGTPQPGGGFAWQTVLRTEPYPRNAYGSVNHLVNALALSPDGAWLFVNSGSRTDHGEPGPAGSTHAGVREVPMTSAVFRVPATATNLVLPNDEAALRAGGYLFADGVRNTFSLAFDAAGRLYGAENSGDRDDGDEINWLREDHHYGFPWRMGVHDTPQRFAGYNPEADVLLNPAAAGVQAGLFHDDPTYPAPPPGITFTDPVVSAGPDADRYREVATGTILDASDSGQTIRTLTSHSSPLGLAFDIAGQLPPPYTSDGLVVRFTGGAPGESVLFEPFGESGEDLLHLDFSAPEALSTQRIVAGFSAPTDAVLVGRTLVVVELGGSLWAVDFTGTISNEPAPAAVEVRVGPNPFADRLHVALRLNRAAQASVDVFDVLGRRVGGATADGQADLVFDGSDWAPGAYVVRVQAGGATETRLVVRR